MPFFDELIRSGARELPITEDDTAGTMHGHSGLHRPADWLEHRYGRTLLAGADRGVVIADAPPAEIKSKVAGKRVRFVAPALSEKDLGGLPVTAVTIKDHNVQLLTNQPESVLRELFRRGVQISDLEVSGADLEDAFIAMTTH